MSDRPWEKYAAKPWEKYAAKPAEDSGVMSYIDNLARQAAQGAAFGFADEVSAGLGALTGIGSAGGTYEQNLQVERQRDAAFEAANPWASLAARVVGGAVSPVSRALPIAKAGAGLVSNMGRMAAGGGAAGALAGFGEGEGGLGERAGAALAGGIGGAAIGAALPPIGEAVSRVGGRVAGFFGGGRAETDAQRRVLAAIEAGGQTVAGAQDDLARGVGQPMALVDVAGAPAQGLAQTATRKPGPAMEAGQRFVAARGGLNQSARLEDAIKRGISVADFAQVQDDLMRIRAERAGPLYERALSLDRRVDVAPIVQDIEARLQIAKGDIKATLSRALGLFRGRGGQGVDTSLVGLHETKLALDAMLERTPTNSVSRVARRELAQVQQRLLAAMDEASGGAYKAARDAFAGPSRASDAMDLGARVLRDSADETAEEVAKLSASEKEFFKIGVSRAMKNAVMDAGDNYDQSKINRLFGSQTIRGKVAAAFDSPEDFAKFAGFMERELGMAKVNAMVDPRAGSMTAKALFQSEQAPPISPWLSTVISALRGDPVGVATSQLSRTPKAGQFSPQEAAEVARYLLTTNPPDRDRLLLELLRRQTRDVGMQAGTELLSRGLLGGAGAGVGSAVGPDR